MAKRKVGKSKIKTHMQIMLPRETLEEILDIGDDVLLDELCGRSRWSVNHRMVFTYDGTVYETYYSVGATEMQDERPWEYEDAVKCTEVRAVKVEKIEYKRVLADGGVE